MPIITLTTDFGPSSRYVAQMKGELFSGCPGVTVVDLSHEIAPQDVAAGARFLEQATQRFPGGTVHLAVIDPGVGTDRAIVAVRVAELIYLAPDNGLLGWLEPWAEQIVTLDPKQYPPEAASCTFHGRDLMAPAAARLAQGASLEDLGPQVDELVRLPHDPEPKRSPGRVDGRVVEIDRFGNLITNIKPSMLGDATLDGPLDELLEVTCGEHRTTGLWLTYGDQPPQTLVALVGSDGFIELAIVNGSAAAMLGARLGDPVRFDW